MSDRFPLSLRGYPTAHWCFMKDLSMLVWLSQVGISVAAPLAAFVFCGVWLREQFDLGVWVIWVGLILGGICAVTGFRQCLQLMDRMADRNNKNEEPPLGFNEHI